MIQSVLKRYQSADTQQAMSGDLKVPVFEYPLVHFSPRNDDPERSKVICRCRDCEHERVREREGKSGGAPVE